MKKSCTRCGGDLALTPRVIASDYRLRKDAFNTLFGYTTGGRDIITNKAISFKTFTLSFEVYLFANDILTLKIGYPVPLKK
jgi:hypothetical protein